MARLWVYRRPHVLIYPRLVLTAPAVVTWTTIGPIYLFTAANWGRRVLFFFEVTLAATTGTVYARLFNVTTSTAVANSQINTTSSSADRVRSSAIAFTDGDEYRVQVGVAGSDTGTINGAAIIVVAN